MVPLSTDQFFRDKYGHYVAWPLHSPALPEHSQMVFIDIDNSAQVPAVNFVRNLTRNELEFIHSCYLLWGMKLAQQPWALVMGRVSQWGTSNHASDEGPFNSIGV